MKTVYICSEYFAPYQNVGSVKFTKIAKFLSRNKEYKVIVFTRKNFDTNDILLEADFNEIVDNGGEVYFIDAGERYYSSKGKILKKTILRIHSIALSRLPLYYYFSNKISANKFKKGALKVIDAQQIVKPDYIISTYDDWGGHCLAADLKNKWKEKVVWISDFRDLVGADIRKGIARKLCDKYSLWVTEKSDYTTVISEGLLQNLQIYPDARTEIAPNGFDYEDYEKVLEDKKKLHFVYTGSFYHRERTLEPVLRALRELINEEKVQERYIAIEYAGAYGSRVYGQIRKFHFEKNYIDWGEVSRYSSILLQDRGDILMTAVWNSREYQGVIAGKTLGYLMLKKPIIAIVGGDLGNSDMKQLVKETNCGFCYEKANHENDYPKLKQVILDYYLQKMKTGSVTQEYTAEVEKYNLVNVEKIYEGMMG